MKKVHNGRLVFDHLPKTAGQAIQSWLSSELGDGSVTTNLIGNHAELVCKFGGNYSVISGHIGFIGEGLNPKYDYTTCLREPIDRAISWLFFVLKNHNEADLPKLWKSAKNFVKTESVWVAADAFLRSEGELVQEGVTFNAIGHHLNNPYVEHFARIDGNVPVEPSEKLAKALKAIEQYTLWGLFERMPEFIADFAAFLEVPAPQQLAPVNVTKTRPKVDAISPKLRQRLEELNALDIEFYRILKDKYDEARKAWHRPAVSVSRWLKYDTTVNKVLFARGYAELADELPVTFGVSQFFTLTVKVFNESCENWKSLYLHPINLSYHWLDVHHQLAVFEGKRTSFPAEGLAIGQSLKLSMGLLTPSKPGKYKLKILPVQEMHAWFDALGFTPLILDVEI